jgi:AraC-like DNA-binding protein
VRHAQRAMEDPLGDTFALALLLTRVRSQARRPVLARRAGLDLRLQPTSKQSFERFFGCPVESAREAFFELADAPLDARQLSADPSMHRVLAEQVVRTGRSLPAEVMAETRRWLSRGAALEDIARARGETGRTLQRRLAAVGLTWRVVRDSVREDEARTLLEQGRLSLPEIAEALGFADQAVFARAFSRWTGVTPSRYRREALAGRRERRPRARSV